MLSIGEAHFYANDIDALRRLAEVNPDLADKVINQRDAESHRANVSYRFGIGVALVFVGMILWTATEIFKTFGLLGTVVAAGLILGAALFVRTILTGQWSETSWFGKLVGILVKALGGRPNKPADPDAPLDDPG